MERALCKTNISIKISGELQMGGIAPAWAAQSRCCIASTAGNISKCHQLKCSVPRRMQSPGCGVLTWGCQAAAVLELLCGRDDVELEWRSKPSSFCLLDRRPLLHTGCQHPQFQAEPRSTGSVGQFSYGSCSWYPWYLCPA